MDRNLSDAEAGQISTDAAKIYDREFVPALFGQFAPILAEAADLRSGNTVLDVGCGTGVAALAALERVGQQGKVTGIDINPGMLTVARQKSGEIDWIEAAAEDLPFATAAFDVTLSQFTLMFFADRTRALREMTRVTGPGGRIALLTWEAVERTPGYDRLIPLLTETAGPEAGAALSAPFVLGEPEAIRSEFERAGLDIVEHRVVTGTARHASLDAWIDTEIGGWTLAETISTDQLRQLKDAARSQLSGHVAADGRVAFPAPAHLVIAAA